MDRSADTAPKNVSPAPGGFMPSGRANRVVQTALAAALALVPGGCGRAQDAHPAPEKDPLTALAPSPQAPLESFVENEKRARVPQLSAQLRTPFLANYAEPIGTRELRSLVADKPLTPASVREALDAGGYSRVDIERFIPAYRFQKDRAQIASAADLGSSTPLELADSVARYVCSRMKYDALEAAQDPKLLEQYEKAGTAVLTDFHLHKIAELLSGPLAADRSPSAEFFRGELAKPGITPDALASAVFARARSRFDAGQNDFKDFLVRLTSADYDLASYGRVDEISDLLAGGVGVCRHLAMAARDIGNALAAEKLPGRAVFTYAASGGHAFLVLFWRDTPDGPTYKTYVDLTLLLRGKPFVFPDGSNPEEKEEFYLRNEKGPDFSGPAVLKS